MGGGGGRTSSKLRKAAKKMMLAAANACGSFSTRSPNVDDPIVFFHHNSNTTTPSPISGSPPVSQTNPYNFSAEEAESAISNNKVPSDKNLCAICLDPLSYHSNGRSSGNAIFTAQCSHAFHFSCISSNVHHGSVTCPICRAHWTQLPRNLNPPGGLLSSCKPNDPILQILDDSIATFRIHRRSFLRSAHYDDDDPIEPPDQTSNCPRLQFSIAPLQPSTPSCSFQPSIQMPWEMAHPYHLSPHHLGYSSTSVLQSPTRPKSFSNMYASSNRAYLSVRLVQQRATDLVLVACPNGPHLRLVKQCMALVVFSLRPIDRLAIVTYSSAAARVFPLRRMTSYGKRTALQVIDRLFYMGQADPVEGLKKGIKILQDRVYKNPDSGILHISDTPTRSYHAATSMDVPIPVHRFHVGFGFGNLNGFVMHEFEEFLRRIIGGVVKEIQLKISTTEEGCSRIVRIGELRSGEERKILVDLSARGHICVGYSYTEDEEPITTGETVLSIRDGKSNINASEAAADSAGSAGTTAGGRPSSAENWDYHDPYMARRWAKHLHGYRL